MNRYAIPTLLLVAVLALGVMSSASAQTAQYYPAELQYYDAQIDLFLPRLDQFQYDYHVVNGRYYQALESHSAAPDVPVLPDRIYNSPTDQPESLALLWEVSDLPDVLAWSYRVDVYSGPEGDGYALVVTTVIDGVTWQRAVNFGPDAWRGYDWYAVVEE